ncbi:hypothetical protein Tco_0060632 [Tanacetum coccineum]
MWSSTKTVAPTPSFAIIQLPVSNNFHIKGAHMQMIRDNQFDGRIRSDPHRYVDNFLEINILFQYGENQEKVVILDLYERNASHLSRTWSNQRHDNSNILSWFRRPTQEILDARGIFLYKTLNEFFKILEDKVLLKLNFSEDPQNPESKTVVSVGRSNIDSYHAILSEMFEALTRKFDSEFFIIRKVLKEMRDGHRDNHASQVYMSDDTPMCDPMEANYVQISWRIS